MRQYFYQKERERDYTIRVTSESGCSNEIVATVTTKRAAIAAVARYNKTAVLATLRAGVRREQERLFLCKACDFTQHGADCDAMICDNCGACDWSPR